MHPAHLARRTALVDQRTAAATERLAAALGVEFPPLSPAARHGGPEVARLFERERMALILGAVVQAVEGRAVKRTKAEKLSA